MAHKYIPILTKTVACIQRHGFQYPLNITFLPFIRNVNISNCRRYGNKIPETSNTMEKLFTNCSRKYENILHETTKKSTEVKAEEKSRLSDIPQRSTCIENITSQITDEEVKNQVEAKNYASASPTAVSSIPQFTKCITGSMFVIASRSVNFVTPRFWETFEPRSFMKFDCWKQAMIQHIMPNKYNFNYTSYNITEELCEDCDLAPIWIEISPTGFGIDSFGLGTWTEDELDSWQDVNGDIIATNLFYNINGRNRMANLYRNFVASATSLSPLSTYPKVTLSAICRGAGSVTSRRAASLKQPVRDIACGPRKPVCGRSGKGRMETLAKLLQPIQKKTDDTGNKVTVVGVGQVGMAAVFAMLTQGVTTNIALVDVSAEKVKGEMLDLQHGSAFMRNAKITGSTDYAVSAGSKICIVTAGVRQREGETRLDLVQRNTDVLKMIIPQLLKYSPDTILLIASNPVDILTYVTWKLSGLPVQRVIGSGTNLDSARFRYLLSERIGIAPTSCHGYIIGEHGDTSVPVWSGVNIAGVRLNDLNKNIGSECDSEKWNDVHENVVNSAYEVIKLKGYTSWAIGLSLSQLAGAILTNANSVHPVTTYVKGEHGIKDDVFLSLPCVLGTSGVYDIIRQPLTDSELQQLHKSAQMMAKVQAGIKF